MTWNTNLTGVALSIASSTASPLRVMAGPGTGKSFAMKRRIARLLEEGVVPGRILAVTFTRNAAASMLDDLNSLGVDGSDLIVAGTLHGFCFRLLNHDEVLDLSGRVPRAVVTFSKKRVLQFEGKSMLQDVAALGAFGGTRDCSKRIRAFEAAWARLQSEEPGWPMDTIDAAFQLALSRWLHFHRGMLIGELVPEAFRYLRNNPACDARSAFDYIIVDEYQDLNRAEQDLLDLLASHGETAVVGDVDQSIYRFRHANPEGIAEFAATHPTTHDENLVECRRCPKRVVAIADHLIRQNHPGTTQSRLFPRDANQDGEIHTIQWPTIPAEIEGLGEYVVRLCEGRYAPADILILTPRRLIGYAIRDLVAASGVAVHSFYHEEALESIEAQKAFCLLTLLVDHEDRIALRWWLGHKVSTGAVGPYRRLREHCEESGLSPWQAMTALLDGSLRLPNAEGLLSAFRDLRRRMEALSSLELRDLVDALLPEGSVDCSGLREAALLTLPHCNELPDLFGVLLRSVTQPELPDEGEFVKIMSLHKSKGLTSKVVIVAGCIEGLLPNVDSDETLVEQAQMLMEQRRLFYVAVTRCTEVLVLSSALGLRRELAFKIGAQVYGRGSSVRAIASRFFGELGPSAPPPRSGSNWKDAGYT